MVDGLGFIFLFVVRFITANVLIFREYYIIGEVGLSRYYYLLIGFVCSMAILIISPSYLSMLFG